MVKSSSISNLSAQVSNIFTSAANPYSGKGFRLIERSGRDYLQVWGKNYAELITQMAKFTSAEMEKIESKPMEPKLVELSFAREEQMLGKFFQQLIKLGSESFFIEEISCLSLKEKKIQATLNGFNSKKPCPKMEIAMENCELISHTDGNKIFTIALTR